MNVEGDSPLCIVIAYTQLAVTTQTHARREQCFFFQTGKHDVLKFATRMIAKCSYAN